MLEARGRSTGRRPGLLVAAAALAAPAPLAAQPGDMPEVEIARVVAAMEVCRRAPADRAGAFAYARAQGFGDLPPEIRARIPVETLVREDVRLRIEGPVPSLGSSGNCTVYATIGKNRTYEEVVATLTALFGGPGEQGDGQRMSWRIDGRYIGAWRYDDGLQIFVGFPELTQEQIASAREERRQRDSAAIAELTAATPVAPAGDIAAAAAICVAAAERDRIATSAIEGAGWVRQGTAGAVYSRPGNNARIFASDRQCVVDAYGETAGSFDAIRTAISAELRALFGDVRFASSSGDPGGFSRGQGFIIGRRLGILSSERRPNGLSIRFTVMSMR